MKPTISSGEAKAVGAIRADGCLPLTVRRHLRRAYVARCGSKAVVDLGRRWGRLAVFSFFALVPAWVLAADVASLRALEAATDDGSMENAVVAELRTADAGARDAIEQQLISIATDAHASLYGRRHACRILRYCATQKAAAALAPLLVEPAMADHARLVIEGVQSPVADLALIAALGQTDGEARRSIIASLAARGTGAAFAPLTELATRGDEATAIAALHALGTVARDASDADRIAALPLGAAEPLLVARQEAFFSALSRLADRGVNLDAVKIPFPEMQARTPEVADLAVVVILRLNPAQAVPQIIALLQSGDPDNVRRAAGAIGRLTDATARAALVAHAAEVPATTWPVLIRALAAEGGAEIRPLVRSALSADDEPTKLAALEGIGRVGDAADVPELLTFAAGSDKVARAAVDALGRLPDRQVDALLTAGLARADSPARLALPDLFVARVMRDAVPQLLEVAAGAERRLAGECYAAAGRLGDVSLMPLLWERWTRATPEIRPAVERALVAIARGDDTGEATRRITMRWKGGNREMRAAVIRLAGGAGDATALAFIDSLASGRSPNEAALRTLAGWRTFDAMSVMKKRLEAGHLSPALRAVVWDGMFDLAKNRLRTRRREGFDGLRACMQTARSVEDQRRVIGVAAAGKSEPWAALLDEWSKLPGIGAEAATAAASLRQRIDTN